MIASKSKYNNNKTNKRKKKAAKIAFTCERDVFRSTIGDSCYIVPLMFWINVMGKSIITQRLRIIQTEFLVNNMDRYIIELICFWSANFPPITTILILISFDMPRNIFRAITHI